MEQDLRRDILVRCIVLGFVSGLTFPFLSLLLASILKETNFTLDGLIRLHRVYPVHFLIDTVPVITTIAGYYCGMSILRYRRVTVLYQKGEKLRTKRIHDFIAKLINNELDAQYETEGETDPLVTSLTGLRDNLKESREEQMRRKQEDDQKNWVSEGLARFAEIMRIHTTDMEEFSFNIISGLVRYLEANQGGFYLLEENPDGDRYFDMKACYAYDRKKFADRKTGFNEGLIGSCAMERQSVYISDIPDSYLSITSGLGHANPKYLLIVPVMMQDEIFGMLEIASFHEIEQYRIQFVERIAESIAMTLSSLKSNIRTAELLGESREQAVVLSMQEERMRKSMEELKNIQEEAAKQAEKFISFTNSVNHTLIRAEYETNGTLIYANTKFLRKLGYSSNTEVEGRQISMFIDEKDQEWFNRIWERLAKGGRHYEGYMKHMTRQGQDLWTMATYTCIRRDDGSVQKILFLAIDTTEQKKQSIDYESQLEAINRLNIKAEFAPDGKFISCNDLFLETMKYTRKELEHMNVFDLLDKRDIESFSEVWENVTKGKPFQGQLRNLTRYEEEKWFRSTYTAANDMYGEVAKVIFLGTEITHERLMEIETRKKTDQLRVQEEQLKLSGIELRKKLNQTRKEFEARFAGIEQERSRLLRLIDIHPDLVITINSSAELMYLNAAAEEFWKVKREECIRKPVSQMFPGRPTDYDSLIQAFIRADIGKLDGGAKTVSIMNADKKWIEADMRIAVIEDRDELSFTSFFRLSQFPQSS